MSLEEEWDRWLGFVDGQETDASDDPLLAHLSDRTIRGLADGFDDPRITRLTEAYVELRNLYLSMLEPM